jgi:hypothetical protein
MDACSVDHELQVLWWNRLGLHLGR